MQENEKDQQVAKFDFGESGTLELTKTKLIGSVMSSPTMATGTSGRLATLKGTKMEFRVKLNQVQNIEIQPPKTKAGKIGNLLVAGIFIGLAPIGVFAGIGLVLGLMFGGFSSAMVCALIGVLIGIAAMAGLFVWYWKKLGGAYLVFSVDGRDIRIFCAEERFSELEAFAKVLRDTQTAYME